MLRPKTICKTNEPVPTVETHLFYSLNGFQVRHTLSFSTYLIFLDCKYSSLPGNFKLPIAPVLYLNTTCGEY